MAAAARSFKCRSEVIFADCRINRDRLPVDAEEDGTAQQRARPWQFPESAPEVRRVIWAPRRI